MRRVAANEPATGKHNSERDGNDADEATAGEVQYGMFRTLEV